eukprot:4296824-Prymnesium_polylepis.1
MPFFWAVSAVREVGLGLCSVEADRPSIPGPSGASDGSDERRPATVEMAENDTCTYETWRARASGT